MKKKLSILLALVIGITVFTVNVPPVYAQDQTTDTQCTTEMKPYIQGKSSELRTYFKTHFASKKTNTSLLELAVKRFDEYKRDLNAKYKTYYPQSGLEIYSESLDTIKCYNQIKKETDLMEKLLRSYFVQTAEVKKSSAIMEKMKQINKKMDELMKNVLQMYGKLLTLKGRIPCFVKECV